MDIDQLIELDDTTKDNIARDLWMIKFDADKIPDDVLKCILSEKNSTKAADRMKYRLEDLLKYPDSFTPSYKNRYKTMIENSQSLHPLEAYAMTHL